MLTHFWKNALKSLFREVTDIAWMIIIHVVQWPATEACFHKSAVLTSIRGISSPLLRFKVSWRTEKWRPLFLMEKRRSGESAIYCFVHDSMSILLALMVLDWLLPCIGHDTLNLNSTVLITLAALGRFPMWSTFLIILLLSSKFFIQFIYSLRSCEIDFMRKFSLQIIIINYS